MSDLLDFHQTYARETCSDGKFKIGQELTDLYGNPVLDLNEYKEQGLFYVPAGAINTYMPESEPTAEATQLLVLGQGDVKQIFYSAKHYRVPIASRLFTKGEWSQWKTITEGDKYYVLTEDQTIDAKVGAHYISTSASTIKLPNANDCNEDDKIIIDQWDKAGTIIITDGTHTINMPSNPLQMAVLDQQQTIGAISYLFTVKHVDKDNADDSEEKVWEVNIGVNIGDIVYHIKEVIHNLLYDHHLKLINHDTHLTTIDNRLDDHDTHLTLLDTRVSDHDTQLTDHDNRIKDLESTIVTLADQLKSVMKYATSEFYIPLTGETHIYGDDSNEYEEDYHKYDPDNYIDPSTLSTTSYIIEWFMAKITPVYYVPFLSGQRRWFYLPAKEQNLVGKKIKIVIEPGAEVIVLDDNMGGIDQVKYRFVHSRPLHELLEQTPNQPVDRTSYKIVEFVLTEYNKSVYTDVVHPEYQYAWVWTSQITNNENVVVSEDPYDNNLSEENLQA